MTVRLQLQHPQDWLIRSRPDDTRLFHADAGDRIWVCPPHLGRGYFQEIPLQDDLALIILDYTLDQDLVVDVPSERNCLEFAFHLASPSSGYSFFCPYFGLRDFWVKTAHKRLFKVEIWCRHSAFSSYLRAFLERLSPQTLSVIRQIVHPVYRVPQTHADVALADILISKLATSLTHFNDPLSFFQMLSSRHCADAIALKYSQRQSITPAMEQVIGNILSCPYQGATRRAYLKRQALVLVALRLEAMVPPNLSEVDIQAVHQAAAILRFHLVNPPSVENLARQVATNRFKLNQGFHAVYGTTPFGYLRDCRLWQAQRLLMTSELSISQVALAVGYSCRSKFATAFRQHMGINPKAFQLHAWEWAS